ncbi:MAG: 30S ribosomal protein S1 [Spirochaetia bacterium]
MSEKEPISNGINQIELQEEYLKQLEQLEEGQLIEGTVVQVNDEQVFIDIGYKSEGKIPVSEFDKKPEIGETVDVVLINKENKRGEVILSKRKADAKVFWKDLRNAFQNREPVEGTVAKNIKGGFEVDLGNGVSAFTPMSKMDISRIEKPEEYVGMKSRFYLERLYNEGKVNIILSRRNLLEEEIEKNREYFFNNVTIGDTVEGTVKSFTSFGAFIDLGGFDGLLHINDMSWGHVTKPKDFVKKGQKIQLKVIRLDPEEQRINLSLKHFTEDPWLHFEDRYNEGDVVKGKVTKLTDFGAFIELEEGIEGLAHISELSWVKRISHPKEILAIGDEVETKILGYDIQQGRVSLGLKQVYPNPWENIEEKYPVGKRMKCVVKKITNAGAFLELEEGIDGFLHVDDLSWTQRIKSPNSVLTEGEEQEVVVISINKENNRIQLGVKQLSDDPWKGFARSYPKGSIIEGEVTTITDFGMFVKVPGGIEGLINKNQLSDPAIATIEEAFAKYEPGSKVKAVVSDINPNRQKLSLSIREYQNKIQREELSKYIHDDDEEPKATLGDLLKKDDKDNL